MSTAEPSIPWVDHASDRLNPILVKESRQSLKSRQFAATFLLMLVASWLISLFTITLAGPQLQFNSMGGWFFVAYYVVLAVASFIIVPFGAYRSLLNERDLNTDELLSITTLSPRKIVWGKLQSALLQLFIYYSAITPFMAFTNLLKGISVATIAFVLVASMFASVLAAILALMISTFARLRHTQVLLSLVLLAGLGTMFIFAWMMVVGSITTEIPFDNAGMWGMLVVMASYYVLIFLLALQISTAQLTFESDNHSTGIRVTAAGLFWLSVFWIALFSSAASSLVGFTPTGPYNWWMATVASLPRMDRDSLLAWLTLLALWLTAFSLFAVTEDEHLSRRVSRGIPRRRLWRLLAVPLFPGGGRGFLYFWGHLLAFVGVGVLFNSLVVGSSRPGEFEVYSYVVGLACYMLMFLGYGAWLGRLARQASGDVKAAHARVLIIFLFSGSCVLPHILSIFFDRLLREMTLVYITDPFSTSALLLSGDAIDLTLPLLAVGALGAVLLNLRFAWRGAREVLATPAADVWVDAAT